MTAPLCTPLDSGGLWCQASVTVGNGGLSWQQMLLAYAIVLLVTWTPLVLGRRIVA